jgi:hypothetical protein
MPYTPSLFVPAWVRVAWLARGLCQQCGSLPYATVWAGNGWHICQSCCDARQNQANERNTP